MKCNAMNISRKTLADLNSANLNPELIESIRRLRSGIPVRTFK
jgi:hypothetical protein